MHTNLASSTLHYPLNDLLPLEGQSMEVAPGVRWIRMGLPFALDHINLWLLRDHVTQNGKEIEGWTVVDCCVDRPASRAQWESIFATELQGLPILRVLVTHMHPDHIGLAHWLCDRWQAPLWISATDYSVAKSAIFAPSAFGGEDSVAFYTAHGMRDPEFLAHVGERSSYYADLVPNLPTRYVRLMDEDTVRIGQHHWRCIVGHGHAPEHMGLFCTALGVLISGDMVLPRISTNVSVHAQEPESNPLELFLRSLDRHAQLSGDLLVLPSHGKPFYGLHERLRQLRQHHHDRLTELREACQGRKLSACDAVPILFPRSLDAHQMTFALGEALAHLHWLWKRGELMRTQSLQGVFQFSGV